MDEEKQVFHDLMLSNKKEIEWREHDFSVIHGVRRHLFCRERRSMRTIWFILSNIAVRTCQKKYGRIQLQKQQNYSHPEKGREKEWTK